MNYNLNQIFEFIRNGANIKQFDTNIGYPITRIETIANLYIDTNKMGYANIEDLGKFEDYLLKEGDILMSHINSEKHLGKSAIYENISDEIIHGMNLLCLRPNRKLCYPKYLNYFFNSSKFRRQLPKITKKSVNQASFSVSDLKELKINLPNIETQKNISEVLDKSEEVIVKRKEQIDALDELVKSQFIEMFGDPIINDKSYEAKLGENLFKLSSGKPVPQNKRMHSGIPAYGGNGVSFYTTEILFEKNTIIIGRVGFQSGNVHLAQGPLWITDNAMYISEFIDSEYELEFLYALMEHIDFTRFQDPGDLKKITQKPLMQMKYIKPPLLLQKEYVSFVKQVDKLKFEMEKSLKELEDNFNSLMQKAFKGELFK